MNRRGFTLIELSIVLVIIGLIVGGVLVGRDLIEAAKVRAQVSQLQRFDAAINTFRVKYGGLPGDLQASQAAAIGMAIRAGSVGHGDGNGVLDACSTGGSEIMFGCESTLFWNDLATAGLIGGNYSLDTDNYLTVAAGNASQYLPDAALGASNSVAVFSSPSMPFSTYYPLECEGAISFSIIANFSSNAGSIYYQTGITPIQAYAIDSKIDDGIPNTGRVQGAVLDFYMGTNYQLNLGITATSTGTCLMSAAVEHTHIMSDPVMLTNRSA